MAKREWLIGAAAFAAFLTLGAPVRAQEPAPARAVSGMQAKRARVEAELEANPALVDDPKYLAAHPLLQRMLERHPEAREKIKRDPRGFFAAMNRRRRLLGGR